MNRSDIEDLQSIREYPSVSVFLPVYRKSPEDQRQNPVRVKNAIKQAEDRLFQEFSKRDIEPLLERLEALTREIDYAHPLDGLALFANKNISRFFWLPFLVEERIVVNATFATRDLVIALNRSPRYWVLVLTERLTRLYQGWCASFVEVTTGGFPLPLELPGVTTESPTSFGVEESDLRNKEDRHYFIRVDKALGEVIAKQNLPLVVVGIERDLATFKEVSAHTDQIIATLAGRHRDTPAHDLAQLVWPLVEQGLAEKRKDIFQKLDAAIGAKRFAAGIQEAWRLAHEGRVNTLVVEEDFHYPARLDGDGQLVPMDDTSTPDAMDDAVDDIIETVLNKSGQVAYVDHGALQEHGHIAVIQRY